MAKPNWNNRTLFHGDNLDFMRAMNSNTVDLIATDPPFNKGRDFHATPDSLARGASFQDRWSWEADVHDEWVDQITDDHPNVMNVINGSRLSYGNDMGAFLCFMGVRLLAMKRILKNTGSIYLHCDPTASHYLKELMDAVFGVDNFCNEITWRRTSNTHNDSKRYGRVTDHILFYTKSCQYIWNQPYTPYSKEYINKNFIHNDSKGSYSTTLLTAEGLSGGGYKYEYHGHNRIWKYPEITMLELEKNEMIYFPKKINGIPRKKFYLDNNKGVPLQDNWVDIERPSQSERMGYPTQKPLALYERILSASSNKGDVVFDPFAGCATTCVAAEKLERNWIGIDIWDKAHEVVIERLKKECHLESAGGGRNDLIFTEGDITYTSKLPERTDDGEIAVPFLRVKEKVLDDDADGEKMSRKKMVMQLLEKDGCKCQGCFREFDSERYLELDHKMPRADGGSNRIKNRILLCSPCNRLKSNILTLSGLIRENKKLGYMAK